MIDGSTVLTHILWAYPDAELLEDLDGEALEADELHHVELGWLCLEDLQGRGALCIYTAKHRSCPQQLGQDRNTVVSLQTGNIKTLL